MEQLAELLGKSQSTLYGHMAALRSRGALRWRSARDGTLIVSFEDLDEAQEDSEFLENDDEDSKILEISDQDSRILEKPDSLTPPNTDTESNNAVKETQIPIFQKIGKSTGKKKRAPAVPQSVLGPFVNTLADVTGMDRNLNYGRLAKEAKDLHISGYTAQQVAMIYGKGRTWYTHDWRGQQGRKPEIGQIRHTISELLENQNEPPPKKGRAVAAPEDSSSFRAAILASKEKFSHGDS
jgi:hypothetical protein